MTLNYRNLPRCIAPVRNGDKLSYHLPRIGVFVCKDDYPGNNRDGGSIEEKYAVYACDIVKQENDRERQ